MYQTMRLIMLLLLLSFTVTGFSQKKVPTHLKKQEREYQRRIKKAYINKVYIPKDLGECFIELNKLTSRESRAKFKGMSEADARVKLHYSLGRWIWHNWGLFEGSRLSVYFNKTKVNHPEDMATFIIIAYHRYLNKKEIKAKEIAQALREARDRARNKRKKNSQ